MNRIRIQTEDIIRKLTVNKKRYVDSMEAVLSEWKKLNDIYQEEYRNYSKKVYEQKLTDDDKEPCPPPKPIDREKDYNFYIEYLGTDLNKNQELEERDYRKLILDQWDWMTSHINNLQWYSMNAISSEEISSDSITGYTTGSGSLVAKAYRAYNDVLNI